MTFVCNKKKIIWWFCINNCVDVRWFFTWPLTGIRLFPVSVWFSRLSSRLSAATADGTRRRCSPAVPSQLLNRPVRILASAIHMQNKTNVTRVLQSQLHRVVTHTIIINVYTNIIDRKCHARNCSWLWSIPSRAWITQT